MLWSISLGPKKFLAYDAAFKRFDLVVGLVSNVPASIQSFAPYANSSFLLRISSSGNGDLF